MKQIIFVLLPIIFALSAYSQNITNTLPEGGVFRIQDVSNQYFTLSQSTGLITMLKNIQLEHTTSVNEGVIFKKTDRFLHDYKAAGTAGGNTFLGVFSGNFTLSSTIMNEASHNTGIGAYSLYSLTTGYKNTAVGYQSLNSNTTGGRNTAVGYQSLNSSTISSDNVAIGALSLSINTTGDDNTAVGSHSLNENTTGDFNTAVGYLSLKKNTTGDYNTAVGMSSLNFNTEGQNNTAVGMSSLMDNTTGNDNTAVGYYSLRFSTGGYNNTSIGDHSLYNNTNGYSNTAMGFYAGYNITTGSNNTIIGFNALPSSATVSNEITLGNGSVNSLRCAVTTITSLSDARDKKNINDLNLGIDFLMKVKPRMFNWDKREWYTGNKSDGSKIQKTPTAGFIAQELDEVQIKENTEWLNLVLKNNPEKLEATPGNLLPVMVKAIQELKVENNELKDKLDNFERMQNVLVAEIEKLKSKDAGFKQVWNGN
jgi:trimeric autotransporter adhesin